MGKTNVGFKNESRMPSIVSLIMLVVMFGSLTGCSMLGNAAAGDLLTQALSVPLSAETSAIVTINPGDGNLMIDGIINEQQMLASGSLQYLENNGAPVLTTSTADGHTTFALKAKGGQSQPRLPWEACNGLTEWQVHLNPSLAYDLSALTGGGTVRLDLSAMTITRLAAETGGGNMEVILPDNASDLVVTAKTGAGKITIQVGSAITGTCTIDASSGAGELTVLVPKDVAARIKVTQGNAVVGSEFKKIDETTYETDGYREASNKIDITVGSGIGKVNIRVL